MGKLIIDQDSACRFGEPIGHFHSLDYQLSLLVEWDARREIDPFSFFRFFVFSFLRAEPLAVPIRSYTERLQTTELPKPVIRSPATVGWHWVNRRPGRVYGGDTDHVLIGT